MTQLTIEELSSRLEEGVRAVFSSDSYRQYLNAMSRFHHYSYSNTLPGKRRSRHPSYIPMLMRPSPHVWACDFSDNPGLLKALLASDGKELEINYSDPSMKVKTSPVIVPFPAYDAIKRKKL